MLPFRHVETSQVLTEVGGCVDEVNVTLAFYSDELEPQEVGRDGDQSCGKGFVCRALLRAALLARYDRCRCEG